MRAESFKGLITVMVRNFCFCNKMIDSQWYFGKLRQVEAFQSRIADLYAIHSVLKSRIRRLKIERDKLLLRIEKSLNSEDWGSEEECDFRKALFKDICNVPVGRSYHDRWPGEENAEATDWEADDRGFE